MYLSLNIYTTIYIIEYVGLTHTFYHRSRRYFKEKMIAPIFPFLIGYAIVGGNSQTTETTEGIDTFNLLYITQIIYVELLSLKFYLTFYIFDFTT